VAERKIKAQVPSGTAEGVEVGIKETIERWTEVNLEDGSVLRIKPVVVAVVRIDGQYDAEGNPMYAVRGGQALALVSVPESLKRKA
jgi:uncharacterized OB-fold protein